MMLLSWLISCTLLIGLAPTGSWASVGGELSSSDLDKTTAAIVEYVVVKRETSPVRAIERLSGSTWMPPKRAAHVPQIPQPTAAPQKRQDSGQIQALSGQIAQLSVSIQAISSASQAISQASQSISQSAQQAINSANQQVTQASQAVSRTQSSATSAVLQASQQADSRVAQASASFNSQISANLASVQASASSAISLARAQASSSMVSAINVAASQVQAAKADATAVAGSANNFADQIQRNAVSTTNLAIIVSVSVSGAVILTSVIACVFLRYRRKKRRRRTMQADDKDYEKPVAVRGSPDGGSKFNPWAGGTYAMDRLKLPGFTPRAPKKPEPLNFGFATSDYSDVKNNAAEDVQSSKNSVPQGEKVSSPTGFRLQKPPNVKKAETVRLIRVNSDKESESDRRPAKQNSSEPQRKTVQATSEPPQPESEPKPQPNVQTETQKPRQSMMEKAREALRYSVASEMSDKPTDSNRYTMMSTGNGNPRESKRYTMASEASEEPGWRPPVRASGRTTLTTAQRLAFRDSGEPDSEEQGWKPRANAFSMASVSTLMRSQPPENRTAQPLPKRAGPSFATFPTVRNGPPSMLNRPRPAGPPRTHDQVVRGSAATFGQPN